MKESGYLSVEELHAIGFLEVGNNCHISRKCSFYDVKGYIGDAARVDDFCIIKGDICIGTRVHVCAYSMLSGTRGSIVLYPNAVLAARCSIYTGSNDHSGVDNLGAGCEGIPAHLTKEFFGDVVVGLGVLIGAHVVILPGVNIGDGATVGAGCIVSGNIDEGAIVRQRGTSKRKRDVVSIRDRIEEVING